MRQLLNTRHWHASTYQMGSARRPNLLMLVGYKGQRSVEVGIAGRHLLLAHIK